MFSCPVDRNKHIHLEVINEENGDVKNGLFYCNICNNVYPIIDGIPRFLTENDMVAEDLDEWQSFHKYLCLKKSNKKWTELLSN
ncbi:MAG: hypothetical protein ACFFDN_13395, partial [Candidatus Hodarchaeota archaeon]